MHPLYGVTPSERRVISSAIATRAHYRDRRAQTRSCTMGTFCSLWCPAPIRCGRVQTESSGAGHPPAILEARVASYPDCATGFKPSGRRASHPGTAHAAKCATDLPAGPVTEVTALFIVALQGRVRRI